MKVSIWAIAAVLGLAPLTVHAETPPDGVYDCFGPSMVGTEISLAGAKFSVIGPDAYISRGGASGHFRFDGLTLAMVDGPYAGLRFHKVAAWSFRMLRANGDEGPFMCPLNNAKDPRRPNSW